MSPIKIDGTKASPDVRSSGCWASKGACLRPVGASTRPRRSFEPLRREPRRIDFHSLKFRTVRPADRQELALDGPSEGWLTRLLTIHPITKVMQVPIMTHHV